MVPFQQRDDSPGLVPAEPGTAEAKYFPDIYITRALYPNAHTIPRELYLPRKKGANFNELKFPFGCEKIFVSKAALRRHRVRMHKWRRTPKDLPEEQFEYIPVFDDVKEILRRANPNSKEFIVETLSGSFEWRSLPIEHEKVKEFLERAPREDVILPGGLPTVVLDRWVAGGELIEDEEAEESDNMDMTDD